MRRFPLWPTAIGAATVLVLGLFLAIVVRNVNEMRVLRDETFRIEHTLEVQRELDAVLLAQSEADADVRAFIISGSAQTLGNVRADQQAGARRLHRLAELTRDNPVQFERVQRLSAAIDTRSNRLDRVIAARQGGTIDTALAEARAADTGAPREAVRSLITELEDEETRLLASRRETASRAYLRAVNGRIGSAIVSAALLIAVVVTAGVHARSKSKKEDELVRSEQRAREAANREQEARAEAERANLEKDQFLAVLSHELRTPLNAVLGWAQILQAAGPTEPTIVRALASIRRNAEAQQRLVEDLLDVSRIVSGKLPLEREAFDLRGAIAAAVESIRPAAASKGVAVFSQLDPTAPTHGDAGRIQQVAGNLLSNAVKFTPSGGHISVALRDRGTAGELEVRDDGVGIAADLQPHIFERFRQGDGSTTRAHGGLGLGLAIAKHIVDAHHGTIEVESPGLDGGAVFRVRIPYG
ncbi:MAG TPA: ATP-binding protein [Vicinamibacterales bacterium]|nr:ATP-binding protein [Vicinamibacterales bacterium]